MLASTCLSQVHVHHRLSHELVCSQEGEDIRQKNEGKWEFTLQETADGSAVALDVAVGKYLDSTLIKADVQPSYVRLLIKVCDLTVCAMADC